MESTKRYLHPIIDNNTGQPKLLSVGPAMHKKIMAAITGKMDEVANNCFLDTAGVEALDQMQKLIGPQPKYRTIDDEWTQSRKDS